MRFQEYLKEGEINPNILAFALVDPNINEVSDEHLELLQRLGRKVGVQVKKSKTLLELFKDATKPVVNIFRNAVLYAGYADIRDREALKTLEKEIKTEFRNVEKEDLVSFLINLDRMFFGITAIPRHILQNILGVKFSSYDNWVDSRDYILREIDKIKDMLEGLKAKEELKMLFRLRKSIEEMVPNET